MDYHFAKSVEILGTVYDIVLSTEKDDPALRRMGKAFGYMNWSEKKIILNDRSQREDFEDYMEESTVVWAKKTLRHEIVHAFLTESGLQHNSKIAGNWADNEEMVDWIAIQGPKIMDAWKKAGAL